MTDEGRREDLPLQLGERCDDCLTERGKDREANDEERRDDDHGTQIGYEVQHRGKHALRNGCGSPTSQVSTVAAIPRQMFTIANVPK